MVANSGARVARPDEHPGARRRVLVGIDTGGTYTDAAIIDEALIAEPARALIGKAKRLTTPLDLARGVGAALDAAVAAAEVSPEQIALVSLSTTLATNALVEGVGGRAALVMIGFDQADLGRQGLAEALGDAPLIAVDGGHGPMGEERRPLDVDALRDALAGIEAEAIAVCGHFSVRNPAHEERARDLIRSETGLPVTCSHELSAEVGGPKRGLTALLNARLIGLIDRLVAAVEGLLEARGIAAPLMVVRGDGALVSAGFARARPIETILSGPAASLVGAGWLTGRRDAIISDIGGTTTDIAVLREGRPRLDPAGAEVGGHRTMVAAVAMRTHGLGGDSEVRFAETGLDARILLGPRRVVPVSLLATEHPGVVHDTLDHQLKRGLPGDLDGRFLLRRFGGDALELPAIEAALVGEIGDGPVAADAVLRTRPKRMALRRLVERGWVVVSGFTPTDAAHVTGAYTTFDTDAARKAGELLARHSRGNGARRARDAGALAETVISTLRRRSAELVVDAAFAEDGFKLSEPSRHTIARAALDGHAGLVQPRISLGAPLIGLGASARLYYAEVARVLGATPILPEDGDVANAIGAVVGLVRIEHQITITRPDESRFRVHLPEEHHDLSDFETAEWLARDAAASAVREAMAAAGGGEADLHLSTELRSAAVEGRQMIVEATIRAIATARPRLAETETARPLPVGFKGV